MWSMRLHKHQAETWVAYRIRCFRAARSAISQHVGERWSTIWLRRNWLYAGHRAKGGQQGSYPRMHSTLSGHSHSRETAGVEGRGTPQREIPATADGRGEGNESGCWRGLERGCSRQGKVDSQNSNLGGSTQDLAWASHEQLALEE